VVLDRPYPSTAFFRDLDPAERELRLEVSDDLADHLRWIRGDPRLTAWEESFLAGIATLIRETEGRCRLTQKQWDKFWQISAKVAVPDDGDDDDDDAGDC